MTIISDDDQIGLIDTLQVVVEDCWQTAEEKGFHDAHRDLDPWRANMLAKLALIHSEVSEAVEVLRDCDDINDLMETSRKHQGGKPEGFMSELADIIIRVMDCAEEAANLWLNLEEDGNPDTLPEILLEKMAFNKTRPHLHGRNA